MSLSVQDLIHRHSLNQIQISSLSDDPNYEYFETDKSSYHNIDEMIESIQNVPNSFITLSLNCQSLFSKIDQLKLYLAIFKQNGIFLSAICLQETWLSDISNLSLLQLEDYNLLSKNSSVSSHGGLAIYLHKDYRYTQIEVDYTSTVWESQFIKITDSLTNKKLALGNIYRPPRDNNANYTVFMEEFALILDHVNNISDEAIIAGDFNIDLLKINERQTFNEYFDMIVASGFIPRITLPTRLTESSATLIDNFLCKFSPNCSSSSKAGILLSDISDHLPYYICFNFLKSHGKVPKYYEKKCITTDIVDCLREELKNCEVELDCNNLANPNPNYDCLVKKISNIIQKSTSIQTVKYNKHRHKKNPWITSGLIKSISFRDKLYRKTKQATVNSDQYNSLKINLRTYNKILKTMIRQAKKQYYETKLKKHKGDMKNTWGVIKSLIGRNSTDQSPFPEHIEKDNHLVYNKKIICNTLNEYFVSIGPKLSDEIQQNVNISYRDYLTNPFQNKFSFQNIDEKYVIKIIDSLKPKNCSTDDCISVKLIKSLKSEISKALCIMINQSINTGIFPDRLKQAKVIPIHKKDNKNIISNYRPISILPALSKVFEKVLFQQLNEHFENNGLLSKHQYGFRTQRNTEMAALELVDNLTKLLDVNNTPISVFLDLSKAFDTLDHDILLEKLKYYGVTGVSLKLCQNYLSNRTQYVQIENNKSNILNIKTGVPQGSILGPLLFIIYINDFAKASNKFDMINYADDTTLHSSINVFHEDSGSSIDANINEELEYINSWLVANKLTINVNKSKFMVFHSPQKVNVHIPQLLLNNTMIECVSEFNFLGIVINKYLSWNSHINFISKKISRVLGIMCKLKHIIPTTAKLTIYNTLILPNINYGLLCWGYQSSKLMNLQKKAIRTIINAKYNAHTDPIFKQLDLLKITDIYTISKLKFFFKIVHNMLPSYFLTNFVVFNRDTHEYQTRQSCFLRVPSHNYARFEQGLRYSIVKSVNNLEPVVMQKIYTHSLSGFSRYTKSHIIDKYAASCNVRNCYVCRS